MVAEERAALVARVLERHGRIDVLVNNAGVGVVGLLHELSARDVERVYTTNVTAYADLTRSSCRRCSRRAPAPSSC
jgi:NAD(P)-dependent dehydrogenase (short-subunit alcohol dehydrogenase family)